jgi:mannose-6-phosphate isomerase class I
VKLISPRLVPRVWGGDRLTRGLGADFAIKSGTGERIGEAWFGEIGDPRPLVKLLDVQERLSVQVHPDDALAVKLNGATAIGKHEAWVILDAVPGAQILLGRNPSVSAEQVSAALESGGNIEALLARVPVSAGDALDVPPGTLHALMPGLLVWEVQQPSDLTYRVSDWGRQHLDRPLHLREARLATDAYATAQRLPGIDWATPGVQRIVSNRAFQVSAVVGPWSGELNTLHGATLTLVTRDNSEAQAHVDGTGLHTLQSARCEGQSTGAALSAGAALLVAGPGLSA